MKSDAAMLAGLKECDVLIIGGGPAGSTAATLLAQKGYQVTLIEKARHPRFHIGESLLPTNLPLFEKLGVAEEIKAIGIEKWAAEFVSPWHDHTQIYEFSGALDKSMPHAYHVQRAEFDEILLRNAQRKGANVIEECRVTEVVFLPDAQGAIVHTSSQKGDAQSWRARFVVDASGRDTFLANHFKIKERNEKHNSTALYAHFSGARREEGKAAGNITIFWFDHGWFWFIPLANGNTSIGAVTWPYYLKTRKTSLTEFFHDTVAMCPALAMRLKDAEMVSKVEATGNFAYTCSKTHGTNYLLLGDAYSFIDPVFSSGVLLAMNSAFVGTDTIDTCLREPAKADAALKSFDKKMKKGPELFSWFIYRITDPAMRNLFMGPRNVFRMQEAMLSVLAGDVFGKTPIALRMWMFKCLYYTAALFSFKRTLMARRRRKENIQVVTAGNEVMD